MYGPCSPGITIIRRTLPGKSGVDWNMLLCAGMGALILIVLYYEMPAIISIMPGRILNQEYFRSSDGRPVPLPD